MNTPTFNPFSAMLIREVAQKYEESRTVPKITAERTIAKNSVQIQRQQKKIVDLTHQKDVAEQTLALFADDWGTHVQQIAQLQQQLNANDNMIANLEATIVQNGNAQEIELANLERNYQQQTAMFQEVIQNYHTEGIERDNEIIALRAQLAESELKRNNLKAVLTANRDNRKKNAFALKKNVVIDLDDY